MFCKNCGRQLSDDAAFCPGCGTKRSSGSDSYGQGRSNSDMKNLPSYTKENDLHKSGTAIDSDRKKFSLTGDGHKSFSLADGGGRKPFTLSKQPDAAAERDDGFVRSRQTPAQTPVSQVPPPPPMPTVKPAPAMAKPAPIPAAPKPATVPQANNGPEPEQPAPQSLRVTVLDDNAGKTQADSGSRPDEGEPTGFVNPLKKNGQEIHWGSDGDRNAQNSRPDDINPADINAHMGFAIFCTLCCCLPTGIAAIVFASQVSKHIKDGNYEQAKKSADTAQILCWVSIGLYFLGSGISAIYSALMGAISP